MKELAKNFAPSAIEERLYETWMKRKLKQADTLRPLTGPAVSAYTGSLQRNNSKATFHTCFYISAQTKI